MAIIVEDGSIVEGANSYATEAELVDYAADRGLTLTTTASALLLKTMDLLELQNFKGNKLTKDQPLQWPRSGVYIDGFLIGDDEIPQELKSAQFAIAVAIDEGANPLATNTKTGVKKKVIGPIETEYFEGVTAMPFSPAINLSLSKLVSGSPFRLTTYRA